MPETGEKCKIFLYGYSGPAGAACRVYFWKCFGIFRFVSIFCAIFLRNICDLDYLCKLACN